VRSEGGYSLVELLVVMSILGVVVGGITSAFATGINADADQTRRYQAQQDTRLALDRVRRDVHSACAVSNPATYNTFESSITLYYSSDSCASGTHSITWCTIGSGSNYTLYRVSGAACTTGPKFANYLTYSTPFLYLPPNSHAITLGGGTGEGTAISTQDSGFSLARLHVDLRVNRAPAKSNDAYRLVDDVALRNGPRWCAGVATC
jgi:prepilin-type N-terminal cleavage/methylation domain-containing protein